MLTKKQYSDIITMYITIKKSNLMFVFFWIITKFNNFPNFLYVFEFKNVNYFFSLFWQKPFFITFSQNIRSYKRQKNIPFIFRNNCG